MHHLANTPRGQLARTQQDLVKMATSKSSMKEEVMEHPICDMGFSQVLDGVTVRMDDEVFKRAIVGLMKCRPTAHLWDVVPSVPYNEVIMLLEAPEVYTMTFDEKGSLLQNEFMRNSRMVGFRFELHNVRPVIGDSSGPPTTASVHIYEATDDLGDTVIPVTIRVRYRPGF